jgi:hypothetical protein
MAAGNARKVLGGCLKVAAGVSLLFVVLVAALVGWGLYANSVADRGAQAFCKATRSGEELAQLTERAHADHSMRKFYNDGDVYHFYWQGGIFYAGECEVSTAAGRVVSARQVTHDD